MDVSSYRSRFFLETSLLAAAIASPATAQDAGTTPPTTEARSSTRINDIVVIARKREESLMSVPVAGTAIGEAHLE